MKYLIKNNMSGETVATTESLELAKWLADSGDVWLKLLNGKEIFRWYVVEAESGRVIYSPKDKK